MTTPYSPGTPILLPNGTRIFNRLVDFLRKQYSRYGFDEVVTPTIYKKALWAKSGHLENYSDDMFTVAGSKKTQTTDAEAAEHHTYGLKPMNCPGHCLIFGSKLRSYRDLPIRYADFSPLHRDEISGALSGLTRVRRFHQDDGHIFCRPSQIEEEIKKTLEFVQVAYKVFKLGSYRLALSTRPADHFIGTADEWERAEGALKRALDATGSEWSVKEGDGAFYGPKIDVILKDTDGKEHQTATIQLDFQLPKRFELTYTTPAPSFEERGESTNDPAALEEKGAVTPVLIHRAVLGSVERLMALLIEHYNGKWPFWLNPRQVMIITVNDTEPVLRLARSTKDILTGAKTASVVDDTGDSVADTVSAVAANADAAVGTAEPANATRSPVTTASGLVVDIDDRPISLGAKAREAKTKGYGIIIALGPNQLKVEDSMIPVEFHNFPDMTEEKPGSSARRQTMTASRLLQVLQAKVNNFQ